MTITFFATRRVQQAYFSKLVRLIPGSRVINFKYCLLPGAFSLPYTRIKEIVELLFIEKSNHPKYRNKGNIYWSLFRRFKLLESCWLYSVYYGTLNRNHARTVVLWNGLKYRQLIIETAARDLQCQLIFMENGLIPGHTTIDTSGVNFLNSVPRTPDFFLNYRPREFELKALQSEHTPPLRPDSLPKSYIFVPFQVNTDSQVTRFSPWIKDMFELVNVIAQQSARLGTNSPVFVFKSHPACSQNYDTLYQQYDSNKYLRFITDSEINTQQLIRYSDAVITINSTVGIESLLMKKPVIVLGQAFYSIDGLTLTAKAPESLKDAIQRLPTWSPNLDLLNNFFAYLALDYQLPGHWQDSSDEHLSTAAKRIIKLASGKPE